MKLKEIKLSEALDNITNLAFDEDTNTLKIANLKLYIDSCIIVENALITLEIIRKKRIDVGVFRFCKNAKDYNRAVERNENGFINYKIINQEQFDLLKEVLK